MSEILTVIGCTLAVIVIYIVTLWLTPDEGDKPGVKTGPGGDFTRGDE